MATDDGFDVAVFEDGLAEPIGAKEGLDEIPLRGMGRWEHLAEGEMMHGDEDVGGVLEGGEMSVEVFGEKGGELFIGPLEFDELAVVPAGEDVAHRGGDVVVIVEQVGHSNDSGGAWGDFVFVESSGDGEMFAGEGVVVPADGAGDSPVTGDEGLGFDPKPAEIADAAGQIDFPEAEAVVASGPEFVVTGDEEFGSWEGIETREALFEVIAFAGSGVADDEEGVGRDGHHLGDQFVSQPPRFGVVVMEVGGDEYSHGTPW